MGLLGVARGCPAEAAPALVVRAQLLPVHVFKLWQLYRCTLGLPCFLANVLQLEPPWHKIHSGQVYGDVLGVCACVQ